MVATDCADGENRFSGGGGLASQQGSEPIPGGGGDHFRRRAPVCGGGEASPGSWLWRLAHARLPCRAKRVKERGGQMLGLVLGFYWAGRFPSIMDSEQPVSSFFFKQNLNQKI